MLGLKKLLKKKFLILICFNFCFCFFIFVTYPTKAQEISAIPFFRNPNSLYPSGEMNLYELEKKLVKDQFHFQYLTQNAKKEIWINPQAILKDIEVCSEAMSIKTSERFTILDVQGYWILVRKKETEKAKLTSNLGISDKKTLPQSQWLAANELIPIQEDRGIAVNIVSSPIKEKASWASNTLIHIPPRSRLKIIDFKESWIHVQFHSGPSMVEGYVDSGMVSLKGDFASLVLTEKGTWIPVTYRSGAYLVSQTNEKIPYSKIQAMTTQNDLGLSMEFNEEQGLALRHRVKILKIAAETWSISRLPGHGMVHWKRNSPRFSWDISNKLKGKNPPALSLHTEDLLKRNIFSASFDKKSAQGLVSSKGVYYTKDSNVWTQFSQFKNENLPVQIDTHGNFYVGHMRSADQGLTFSPFLDFTEITELIQTDIKKTPPILKIKDIQFLNPSEILVAFNIGEENILLKGAIKKDSIVTNWKIQK